MLKPGDTLPGGEIRIEAVIGKGAFGVVYRAWDETLSRTVAVKELRRDAPGMGSTTFDKYADRFQREARVQAQFNHPHIVQVHRLVQQGETLYLVMEFVDGPNLRDVLTERGPLPLEEAVQLTLDLLDALSAVHAHEWDIVHRDIKPSNVLIADGRAKLTDFGLAQLASESSRSQLGGNHPGTPLYMSPEQERTVAYLKPASDLYSAGCVLFELLTGKPYKQVDDDPDALRRLRPDTPPALAHIIAHATTEDLKGRYRCATDFATELRAWQREQQAAQEAAREATRKAEQERQQREAEIAARRQREAEERARQQHEAETAAQRRRDAEVAARQKQEAEEELRQEAARKAALERRKRQRQVLQQLKTWAIWGGGALALLLVATAGGSALWRALKPIPTATATSQVVMALTRTPTQTPIATATATATTTATTAATAPATATPTEPTRVNASLGDTWTRPVDDMVMVYVPAGEFQMGSTEGDSDEAPVHTVALDGFWIDRTEVTNAQYGKCVMADKCDPSDYSGDSLFNGDDQPVVGVSWHDAVAYCEWAGGRLPTEAEWEYAARGPEGLTYPWGNEWDCTRGNFDTDCGSDTYDYTAPVGSFPAGASWADALDLSGNVWEWVADWYGSYPSGRQVNPTGPQSGGYRVLRGGSWNNNENITRGANRDRNTPTDAICNGGFRCGVSAAPGQ